ncbi:DUF262 domain-containing protein [Paenibacillus taichungensis]|uniref:DUF262 domain-containing protein n=1 Tax=Paenibacillus taichungensis TaxID=484184 RepID=UPI0038CF44CB
MQEYTKTIGYNIIEDMPGHKNIEDILNGEYVIPTYQRGYRWESMHVEKLLDDLYEKKLFEAIRFSKLNIIDDMFGSLKECISDFKENRWEAKDEYRYCIQPLVVMRKGRMNKFHVLDGQQRLTTITIILSALRFCTTINGSNKNLNEQVHIEYISRPGSKELLQYLSIKTADKSDLEIQHLNNDEFDQWIWKGFEKEFNFPQSIDFDHIINTFRVSVMFFLKITSSIKQEFGNEQLRQYYNYLQFVLLKCTEVIWYVVDPATSSQETVDERKIFANFNTGKLPLTNAELIKAMFMNPCHYGAADDGSSIKDRQIMIAEKWDKIENELHHPDFWSFVPHPGQYDDNDRSSRYQETRIDIFFDFLVMRRWMKDNQSVDYKSDILRYISYHKKASLDPYYTFNQLERWIEEDLAEAETAGAKREVMDRYWNYLREIYTNIRELYDEDGRKPENSSKLYNLIGFYIYASNTYKENGSFYTSYKGNGGAFVDVGKDTYLAVFGFLDDLSRKHRSEREKYVKIEILKLLGLRPFKELSKLIKNFNYKHGNAPIAILLLLYNIAILNKSGGIGNRFHFLNYANTSWQREHIFAQNESYLQNNKLRKEREAALHSLAKGHDNFDYLAGLKENSVMQYINFKHDFPLDYCPVIKNDSNGNPVPINESSVTVFINNPDTENNYHKEYRNGLKMWRKAKKILDTYDWLDASNHIKNSYALYQENPTKRSRNQLLEEVLTYKGSNSSFFENISIDVFKEIGETPEGFVKQQQDIYVFDIEEFNQMVSDKLQIDLTTVRNNPFSDFATNVTDLDLAKREFGMWLEDFNLDVNTNKLKIINKLVLDRYIRKLKKMLWFDIYSKNTFFDFCENEVSLQDVQTQYTNLHRKGNTLKTLSLNKSDLQDKLEYSSREDEIDDIQKEEFFDDCYTIEKVQEKFELSEKDIEFVMIAINSHSVLLSKIVDLFFEKDYLEYLDDHSMGNLTLLSASINSKITNKSYFIKRELIYEEFKRGSFIPLGTVLVFTDLYTKGLNSATQWLHESRLAYFQDLIDTITLFFNGVENSEHTFIE